MAQDPALVLQRATEALAQADRVLTVAQVARKLGTSSQFVRDEIKRGELKAWLRPRPSGRTFIRIPESHYLAYRQTAWCQRQQST